MPWALRAACTARRLSCTTATRAVSPSSTTTSIVWMGWLGSTAAWTNRRPTRSRSSSGRTVPAYARHIPLYVADSLAILARRASGDPASVALRDAGRREVYAWREGEPARRLPVDELAGWLPATARVIVEPAGGLASWVPGLAHLELPASERRPLSTALLESAIW